MNEVSYVERQLGIVEQMWTLELDRSPFETRVTPVLFALVRQVTSQPWFLNLYMF